MKRKALVPRSDGLGRKLTETDLQRLAESISGMLDADVAREILARLQTMGELTVLDILGAPPAATSYWVFLLTGAQQADEYAIATELATWQALYAMDTARLRCIQSNDHEAFQACSAHFDASEYPMLAIGVSPDMKQHIRVDATLLLDLAKNRGELQRFLTKLQAALDQGKTLDDVKTMISGEAFWRGLKVVWQEAKSLISFKFS